MRLTETRVYRQWIQRQEERGLRVYEWVKVKKRCEFSWGLEHLDIQHSGKEPSESLRLYVEQNVANSLSYFTPDPLSWSSYVLDQNRLSFPSSIRSFDRNNNTVVCNLFPSGDRENVIIVVPHWNAPGWKYDAICRMMRLARFSSVRVVLPYHEQRDPEGPADSTTMVSANIGLTIQAMRQSVQDILSLVRWLEHQGYRRIGIIGASIGSCAAFLAAAHDVRIKGFFANLMSSYFGDVVWTGESTRHIRETVETRITKDDLRLYWLLNSPIAFVNALREHNPSLRQFIVSGRYDTTFRFPLTQAMLDAYTEAGITFESAVLPCGHYSLGRYWFKYLDAWLMVRFFQKLFKS